MNQVLSVEQGQKHRQFPSLHWEQMGQASILAVLVGILYGEVLWKLAQNWWNDPNFSHGFFVPIFSVFVVWQQRERLYSLQRNPSWLGLVGIATALGILVLGVLGAELFLSRASFAILLAGLTVYFFGWKHFRAVLFPWAFLFLMIPVPAIIFNQVALPLQLLASRFSSSVLSLLEVPVFREGNILRLPTMSLEVAQACSGIRSLVSLGTLSIIYCYFLEPKLIPRTLLVIASVPIAVLANGLRVVGTGLLVHYWDPSKAEGFFHSFEGWVIFVLSLVMFFGLHGIIRFVGRFSKRTFA